MFIWVAAWSEPSKPSSGLWSPLGTGRLYPLSQHWEMLPPALENRWKDTVRTMKCQGTKESSEMDLKFSNITQKNKKKTLTQTLSNQNNHHPHWPPPLASPPSWPTSASSSASTWSVKGAGWRMRSLSAIRERLLPQAAFGAEAR